jgi:arylsulfatase A-like enzyme
LRAVARWRSGAAAFAVLGLALAACAEAPSARRPNILVIQVDDLDTDALGAYGGRSLTPHMDRLAAEGIRFDRAYVASSVCVSSRYATITGRHASRSTFPGYLEDSPPGTQAFPAFNVGLERDRPNVGSVLRDHGYVTGWVGKFHLGPPVDRPQAGPLARLQPMPRASDPRDAALTAAARRNQLVFQEYVRDLGFDFAGAIQWTNPRPPLDVHNPEWMVAAALAFLESARGRPFFLHFNASLAHGTLRYWRRSLESPSVSPEGWVEDLPRVMPDRATLLPRLRRAGLDDSMLAPTWLDDGVGALLAGLRRLGLERDTLVVLLSDHGSRLKSSLYDRSATRVPLILRWPAGIDPGRVSDELVQNVDLAATFFDLAGATPPDGYELDGLSLRPLFGGAPERWRESLYFEHGNARAVCTKDWKYIAWRPTREEVDAIRAAPEGRLPILLGYIHHRLDSRAMRLNRNYFSYDQLYHLASDPEERRNLASDPQQRARLDEMRARLAEHLERFPGRPFGEFVPGGDAAAPGGLEAVLERARAMELPAEPPVEDLPRARSPW